MGKRVFFTPAILFIILFINGCSPTSKLVKEGKPKVVNEEVPKLPVIKNLDLADRISIKSQKILSVDKVQFIYDSRGKLTNGQKISQSKYNPDGFMTSAVFYTKNDIVDQKYEYKYDKNGFRTETIRYDSKGKVDKKYVYEYNKFGNKEKASRYNNNGTLEKYYLYNYDDKGNLTDDLWYDKSGKLEFKIINHYNLNGLKIESLNYDSNNNFVSKSIFKYDKNGNIIDENRFDDDGNPTGIIQYVYKYYQWVRCFSKC